MLSLVNNNFSRTYNPGNGPNALSDIKRLLTSRDTVYQKKACGYLCEVIKRYDENSLERGRMVEYLLQNDVTVFLCEAMSNLEWPLFGTILSCIRLLWRNRMFFVEDHDAHASSAVVRAMVYYSRAGHQVAVNSCLNFLCDLLNGVRFNQLTPPLSSDSAHSIEQLLAGLNEILSKISGNPDTVLAAAFVMEAFLSHQTGPFRIKGSTASALAVTLEQWLPHLCGTLNQMFLKVDEKKSLVTIYALVCQLGLHVLTLTSLMRKPKKDEDFIQNILNDEKEVAVVQQSLKAIDICVHDLILELVNFNKENHNDIPSEEYCLFISLLYTFFKETKNMELLIEFSDLLFGNGYLHLLPQVHIQRQDVALRKVSTLLIGDILGCLSRKYLDIFNEDELDNLSWIKEIQMGLVELQYGIHKPQYLGIQLQKQKPYCLVIYLYFYCQSCETPQDSMGPLLPDLVKHILMLPKSFRPPRYIIKSLWLVFAMSVISNSSFNTLNERLCLERATEKCIDLLLPNPSIHYTHNPALLLWSFTSQRISVHVKKSILSKWLEFEDSLPAVLASQAVVWDILLNVLTLKCDDIIRINSMKALKSCFAIADDDIKRDFASSLWEKLPELLSRILIAYETDLDPRYILELATELTPSGFDLTNYAKIGVLISTIYTKISAFDQANNEKLHLEYVCLKLCLYLLGRTNISKDSRVLVMFIKRPGFLSTVLQATNSIDDGVALIALQLLSYIIYCSSNWGFKPKEIMEVDASMILRSLRKESSTARGAALLQLVYVTLNSGSSSPISMIMPEVVNGNTAYAGLRGLMFRLQMMCCKCKESTSQSSAGWETLSAIFKFGMVSKDDTKLVTMLTTQPWTYILIQFQLSQVISEEFLKFTSEWITLLNIIMTTRECSTNCQFILYKHSLLYKTLASLNKSFSYSNIEMDANSELVKCILFTVKEIFLNTILV